MRYLVFALMAFAAALAAGAATDDYPLAPANAVATLSDDFMTVTVTWDPVGEVGENGGHVDADQVVYYIFDAFGSYFDPAIAETTETSCTFDYSSIEGQDFVAYQITAGVGDMYSQAVSTNIVAVGDPYTLPWAESFADRRQQQAWVLDQSGSWTVSTAIIDDSGSIKSADGDGGYLRVTPGKKGDTFGMISGKIALGDAQAPVLSFAYMGGANKLEARVSADGGTMATVKTINLKQEPSTADWATVTVPLADYLTSSYIQIELWLDACDNTTKLMLDAISIADDPASSLAAVTPSPVAPVAIYTPAGRLVYTGDTLPSVLPVGLYIVKTGSTVEKISK